jgi:hypothetical protein
MATEVRIGDFRVYDPSGTELYEPTGSAPSAPTGLIVVARGNNLVLNWTASSGATSYNVKRSLTSGGTLTTISTSGAVTTTTYTDSTVKSIRYFYVISAVNTYGESSNSSQAFGSPRRRAYTAG